MAESYIGLMSGTSMDGIDAVLVQFSDSSVNIIATHEYPYADTLRQLRIYAQELERKSTQLEEYSATLEQRVASRTADLADCRLVVLASCASGAPYVSGRACAPSGETPRWGKREACGPDECRPVS